MNKNILVSIIIFILLMSLVVEAQTKKTNNPQLEKTKKAIKAKLADLRAKAQKISSATKNTVKKSRASAKVNAIKVQQNNPNTMPQKKK